MLELMGWGLICYGVVLLAIALVEVLKDYH